MNAYNKMGYLTNFINKAYSAIDDIQKLKEDLNKAMKDNDFQFMNEITKDILSYEEDLNKAIKEITSLNEFKFSIDLNNFEKLTTSYDYFVGKLNRLKILDIEQSIKDELENGNYELVKSLVDQHEQLNK